MIKKPKNQVGVNLDLDAKYYAQAANNTIHDITTEDISISAWVKVDVDAGFGGIFSDYSSNDGIGYIFSINADGTGKIRLIIRDGSDQYYIDSNTDIRDNKWHYVSAIIDRDNAANCKIFLDGYEDGTTVKTGTLADVNALSPNQGVFTLGVYFTDSLSGKFDGQVRDVKLYYAAGDHWTDAQILYQAQHPFDYTASAGTLTDYWRCDEGSGLILNGKPVSGNPLKLSGQCWNYDNDLERYSKSDNLNFLVYNNSSVKGKAMVVNHDFIQKPPLGAPINWSHPLAKGLVGFWLMQEGGGNKIYDLSGNNNHGTLTNMAFPSTAISGWNPGKLGRGLSFDGVNDYASISHQTNFNNLPLTISFWAKSSASQGANAGILNKYTAGSFNGWEIDATGNTLRAFYYKDSSNNISSSQLSDSSALAVGTWSHIVVVFDASGGIIYRNGAVTDTGSWTGTAGNCTTNNNIILGYYGTQSYFNGLIDDVRIFNRALSASEVAQMYIDPYAIFRKKRMWTYISDVKNYFRGDEIALPSNDLPLETLFTSQEYDDVTSDDNVYVAQESTDEYIVFLFKNKGNNISTRMKFTWKGKSSKAPTEQTVYLQIYNRTSSTWETLDSNNIANADEEFTLEAKKTTGLSDYYDENYWVSCRVYQLV